MVTEKRLIDVLPLMTNGWTLIQTGVSNCVLQTKSLADVPTVDAVEVVHGRWIKSKSMVLSAKCSKCKGWVVKHSVNEPDFNYCPNCGARMDLEV